MIENPTEAYALVTATFRGVRYVLLIERGDGAGWAMPGGAIEPDETPFWAAIRKCQEEASLDLKPYAARDRDLIQMDPPRWVTDPRGLMLMETRPVTVVARCDLGEVDALPEVRGGTDVRQVRWIAVGFLDWSEGYLFPAHREILGALR